MFNYPNFNPSFGTLTEFIRDSYIKTQICNKVLPPNALTDPKITSLIASNDPSEPIYFWQLYSILGESPVHTLISVFYEKVFQEPETWFSDEFKELGTLDYHVRGQKRFWLDVMGGGVEYVGELKRLNLRHKLVKNIMTQDGARLWMKNMKKAFKDPRTHLTNDMRVVYCMNDFLNFFMEQYAVEFDFNFCDPINLRPYSKL